ncbi:MAG TPA: RNA polymerase sigma factor SigZ [Thermomicrobiales bacterium]|nr:RNA polymerase sigma factor SigZ [Thermomicrobiales bacterium]
MTGDVEEARWREPRARLHGFVGRRIGNPEDAEDIVQDVLVRMHRNIDALLSADRLYAWAFRSARNAIADHYRSPNRRDVTGEAAAKVMDELAAGKAGGEPSNEARTEMARCIAPMVRGLPGHYRQAIELTELEGMTQAAAAERLGLSVPGAKSRVQRGRARLRAMLVRCCEIETDRRGRVITFKTRDGKGCAPCGDEQRGPIKVAFGRPHERPRTD